MRQSSTSRFGGSSTVGAANKSPARGNGLTAIRQLGSTTTSPTMSPNGGAKTTPTATKYQQGGGSSNYSSSPTSVMTKTIAKPAQLSLSESDLASSPTVPQPSFSDNSPARGGNATIGGRTAQPPATKQLGASGSNVRSKMQDSPTAPNSPNKSDATAPNSIEAPASPTTTATASSPPRAAAGKPTQQRIFGAATTTATSSLRTTTGGTTSLYRQVSANTAAAETPTTSSTASTSHFRPINGNSNTPPHSTYSSWDSTQFHKAKQAEHLTHGHAQSVSKFLIGPPKNAEMPKSAYDVGEDCEEITAKPGSSISAPKMKEIYTIVWDLDETLCSNRGPGKAILRPGAVDLLKSLNALNSDTVLVEQVLWTASVESLARDVLIRLDPGNRSFQQHIFRDRRWFRETGYTKDLRLLGRDMAKTVIIENSPLSVTLNRDHAILVRDFVGQHADQELYAVKEVLEGWIKDGGDKATPIVQYLADHPRVSRTNNIISTGITGGAAAATSGAGLKTSSPTTTTYGGYGGYGGGTTKKTTTAAAGWQPRQYGSIGGSFARRY